MFWGVPPLSALRINLLAYDIKIRDIAGSHSFNGGTPTEYPCLVRLTYPLICSLGERDLQYFLYAYDVGELAKRWTISPRTLERWRFLKTGPYHLKIGGRVVYRVEDVEA